MCLKRFIPILLVFWLALFSSGLWAQSTSTDSMPKFQQIETIKVPQGLNLPPELLSLNEVMQKLGQNLLTQETASEKQISDIKNNSDNLTTTEEQLEKSSQEVQSSLQQSSQAVQTASDSTTKQSSTLTDTTQSLQNLNNSTDKLESDLQNKIKGLEFQNGLWGVGGVVLGVVTFWGLHLLKIIP